MPRLTAGFTCVGDRVHCTASLASSSPTGGPLQLSQRASSARCTALYINILPDERTSAVPFRDSRTKKGASICARGPTVPAEDLSSGESDAVRTQRHVFLADGPIHDPTCIVVHSYVSREALPEARRIGVGWKENTLPHSALADGWWHGAAGLARLVRKSCDASGGEVATRAMGRVM